MTTRTCPTCHERLPQDCFRKGATACVWCVYTPMSRRAAARYSDKRKLAKNRLSISKTAFISWYTKQPDRCRYCGLTFSELKRLRIRRGRGYCVSWDVDRIRSFQPYKAGNLALSCLVCNMAKGEVLTAREAHIVGRAIRRVWRARLAAVKTG